MTNISPSGADRLRRKELFLDDRFIDEKSGLIRRFHQPEVSAENPVIHADRPWERDAAFVDSGLVFYDEDEDLFKAWYQGGACYGADDRSVMCYATSRDGIHWEKPALGQVEFEGSRENNIALMAECMMHDPAVLIDEHDPDPQRRFKAVWWGGRKDAAQSDGYLLGHCVGFSPDGIRWTQHPDNPVWPADGEVAVPQGIHHCQDDRLVMYCSADGHGMRVVARCESDNFVNWETPPTLIFGYDEDDPPGTELGGLAAINYDGTQIGMLWVIRNLPGFTKEQWKQIVDRNIRQGFLGPPIQFNAAVCRTIQTELVVSQDGQSWQRINRDAPLLLMGTEGTWDECSSLAGRPFVAKDKIWIYYTGCGRISPTPETTRPEKIGKWSYDTGLATLRLDGFASLHAPDQGVLVTKPFHMQASALTVNTDAQPGSVRVEVLEPGGQPLVGYSIDEAQVIDGDQLHAAVRWKTANVRDLRGRQIRLKLSLKNADLYSISFLDQ